MIAVDNYRYTLTIMNEDMPVTLVVVTSQKITDCLVHPLPCDQQRSFHGVHQFRKRENFCSQQKFRWHSSQLSETRRHVTAFADG